MKFDNVQFESSFGTYSQIPNSTVPEIVFSGRSNVGKSSLLNKVLNRKSLARVSAQPGKTQTINFFKLDGVRLVDLPGYGYAKVSQKEIQRWGKMIETYFTSNRRINIVFQLVDMRHKPTKDDVQMFDFLHQMEIPFVVVLTKSDKLNKTEYKNQLDLLRKTIGEFNPLEIIPFSAKTGEGSDKIKSAITKAVM